jgi:hypothetical protein
MAVKIADLYLNTNPADANYPGGSFKNASSPTATDGTPFEEQWANDMLGFMQALIALAGVVPSGVPDTAVNSQHLQAVLKIMGRTAGAIRAVAVTGPVIESDQIIVIDASGGDVDLTFLSAAASGAKSIKVFRKRSDPGTSAVNLLPAATETIAGEASVSLLPGEGYEFIPDGTSDYIQF